MKANGIVLLLAACVLADPARVLGCAVCMPATPTVTVADELIAAHAVMLAREDAGKAFSYAVVESLKGTEPGERIGLFLDSMTRRRLAAEAGRFVVLVRDSGKSDWRRLTLADGAYLQLIRDVVEQGGGWLTQSGRAKRFDYFAARLGHADERVYRLAFHEVSRAGYADIRKASRQTPRDRLQAILAEPRLSDCQPLALIMLAMIADPRDRTFVADLFHDSMRFGRTRDLPAIVTAYIELNRERGVTYVADHCFANVFVAPEPLLACMKACSVLGEAGDRRLQDAIVRAYRVLLESHPHMAAHVARDMLTWRRSDLAEPAAKALAAPGAKFQPDGKRAIRMYVATAKASRWPKRVAER